ncbi:MAG: hypothetical protein HOW73_16525 [Polyangiaceae bacterium]|nr:hypothetical protein [Polyangiaceae bacterium]
MSWGQPPNQPPYGQPPYPQYPQQGMPQQGAPFGAPGAYGPGYAPKPPPPKSKAGCIVGIIVGVLLLGTCGGVGTVALKSFSGDGVPSAKSDYVGSWVGKGVALRINKDGTINYMKRKGSGHTNINGMAITDFDGDDFVVGWSFMSTRFEVSEPPKLEDETWHMTVDGVEMIRRAKNDDDVDTLAAVKCNGVPLTDTSCDVIHQGGPYDAEICFDHVIECLDGKKVRAHHCDTLKSGDTHTRKLTSADYPGSEGCVPKGAQVESLKVDPKAD